MKNRFKLFIVGATATLLQAAPPAKAQDSETYGFLNFVNLIPGGKPCKIGLLGKELIPGGLPSGTSTEWFLAPTGNSSVVFEMEGYDKASGSLEIKEGQSSIYVIFTEKLPPSQAAAAAAGKENAPVLKIRMKRCEIFPATEPFQLKMMSFCPGENRFSVGPNPFDIKIYQSVDVPKWTGGGFEVAYGKKVVGNIPLQQEKGPYYLFVGTDHVDNYCPVLVSAGKQQLPEAYKSKKPTQNAASPP